MTIVVFVVLALVWAVVLGPSLFRRTTERHHKDSIGSFHRQLHVLGRTGPALMEPAHSLEPILPAPRRGGDGRLVGAVNSRPGPTVLTPPMAGVGGPGTHRRPDPYFRPGACKRRRDVLMVLLCTLTVTGLVGVIPAMHVLLLATAGVGVVLVAYLALLVQMRGRAAERELKLRYLPQFAAPADEGIVSIRRVAAR